MLSKESSSVCVITVNWNGSADTVACVRALLNVNYSPLTILVVDNQSRTGDVEALWHGLNALATEREDVRVQTVNAPKLLHTTTMASSSNTASSRSPVDLAMRGHPLWQVRLLHAGANLGFAGGMNVGLRHAVDIDNPDYVWLLNNDTEVDPSALDELVNRASLDPRIGLCGSTLVEFEHHSRVQAWGGARYVPWRGRSLALGAFSETSATPSDPGGVEHQMDYVNGASMLVSRAFIERVGLMDERYFLYSEEHDWAHRGRRAGFGLGWAPRSLVFHKHGATIGTTPTGGSELSLFYLYRSKAVFTLRHYPALLPIVLLWLAWDGVKFMLKGQSGRSRAVFRGLAAFPCRRRYEASST